MTPILARMADLEARGLLPLVREVSNHFGVTAEEVVAGLRYPNVVAARHHLMALLRQRYCFSYNQLGRIFGRDHSSCIEGVRKAHGVPARRRYA